jgi:hypothetical protein
MPPNDVNSRADRLITDLLCWARQHGQNVEVVEQGIQHAALDYYRSLLWRTIPIRLADSIELPPVSGEIEVP